MSRRQELWGGIMDRRTRIIAGSTVAFAIVAAGAGVAIASGQDEGASLSDSELEQATAAALAHAGGGTVLETEAGDDGTAYEVEIRLADGRVVEVGLDASFEVVGQATDDDGRDEDGSGEDAEGSEDDR
ncbi:MAG TPA: PepSY domain-containing protein [Actinomycetota bacterium]|jgi:hypothetical protein